MGDKQEGLPVKLFLIGLAVATPLSCSLVAVFSSAAQQYPDSLIIGTWLVVLVLGIVVWRVSGNSPSQAPAPIEEPPQQQEQGSFIDSMRSPYDEYIPEPLRTLRLLTRIWKTVGMGIFLLMLPFI